MKYKYNILEKLLFLDVFYSKKKLKTILKNKTILITGASYGIGESLAYRLSEAEVKIILVARTEEKLLKVKEKIEKNGAKAEIFVANFYDVSESRRLVDFLDKNNLKVDIFVNNAGKSIKRLIYDSLDRFHDFDRTMTINYYVPVQLMLSLIPTLEQKNGQVINVSSAAVLLPPAPYWAAYTASKSAFDIWFKSVRPELKAKKISTTSIYLPLVRTRMIAPTKAYNKMPAMKPEHVADIICKSIIKKKRKYKPWWLFLSQVFSWLFFPVWEYFFVKFFKKQ